MPFTNSPDLNREPKYSEHTYPRFLLNALWIGPWLSVLNTEKSAGNGYPRLRRTTSASCRLRFEAPHELQGPDSRTLSLNGPNTACLTSQTGQWPTRETGSDSNSTNVAF